MNVWQKIEELIERKQTFLGIEKKRYGSITNKKIRGYNLGTNRNLMLETTSNNEARIWIMKDPKDEMATLKFVKTPVVDNKIRNNHNLAASKAPDMFANNSAYMSTIRDVSIFSKLLDWYTDTSSESTNSANHTSGKTASDPSIPDPMTDTEGNKRSDSVPPAHKGRKYEVETKDHDQWYVYILELEGRNVVKVGYASSPKKRLKQYNHKILPEITGLNWALKFVHPCPSSEDALELETSVLDHFEKHKLTSNREVLQNLSTAEVSSKIIDLDLQRKKL